MTQLQHRRDQLSRNWQAEYDRCVRLGLPVYGNEALDSLGILLDAAIMACANVGRTA